MNVEEAMPELQAILGGELYTTATSEVGWFLAKPKKTILKLVESCLATVAGRMHEFSQHIILSCYLRPAYCFLR